MAAIASRAGAMTGPGPLALCHCSHDARDERTLDPQVEQQHHEEHAADAQPHGGRPHLCVCASPRQVGRAGGQVGTLSAVEVEWEEGVPAP